MGRWALDSGGFTELSLFGRWTVTARAYVDEVRRYRDTVGGLLWAAPQDWMCEPQIIHGGHGFAGTGLSVDEHQERTVQNLLELRSIAPDLHFVPVLQGWRRDDYWRCLDLYARAGLDLVSEPIVGIGTVCRRQGTAEASGIIRSLSEHGLRLHGFGFKQRGLDACGDALASSDSLAWSFAARRAGSALPGHERPGPGRPRGHQSCANCAEFALQWRRGLLERRHAQLSLF